MRRLPTVSGILSGTCHREGACGQALHSPIRRVERFRSGEGVLADAGVGAVISRISICAEGRESLALRRQAAKQDAVSGWLVVRPIGCETWPVGYGGLFPAGRDRGVTVAIDGFFAMAWFGWGQAAAQGWLAVALGLGTGLAALLTVAGIVMTRRSAGPGSVMDDAAVRRRYDLIVGLEFGLLGAGAAVLGATGQYRWVPVLVCFGVGVHFFSLASALGNPTLRPLGTLLILVAAAALAVGLGWGVPPSSITGPGAGVCLLAFGTASVLLGRPGQSDLSAPTGNARRGYRAQLIVPLDLPFSGGAAVGWVVSLLAI